MAVTAFDADKAARDLERAGLDRAAAAAIMQAATERRRGALESVPPWLAAVIAGAFLAILGWGALEIKDTGERLKLVEYKADELGTRLSKLETRVTALEEGQRRLEEGQRKLAETLEIVLSRLPPR